MKQATVNFMPKDGKGSGSTGETNDAGEYELDYNRNTKGAMLGDHKVWITTQRTEEGESEDKTMLEFLPKKYSDSGSTELSASVSADEKPINFELTGKEEKRDSSKEAETDDAPCCGGEVIDF